MRACAVLILTVLLLPGNAGLAEPSETGAQAVAALFDSLGPAIGDFRSSRSRDVILETLGKLPREEVLAHLRERALGEVPLEDRMLALKVLKAIRGDAALDLLIQIASDLPSERLESLALSGGFRSAMTAILADEPDLCQRVRRSWRTMAPHLRTICLDAMEAGAGGRGIKTMADLLGSDTRTTVAVLTRFGRLPPIRTGNLGASVRLAVAKSIQAPEAEVCRAAALAAGGLHVLEAFEELLAALDDENEAVRPAAWWALKRISGRRLPPSRTLWLEWYRQETAWAEEKLPELLLLLDEGGNVELAPALVRLSSHRLQRSAIAGPVTRLLTHEEVCVRTAAADCLGSLGDLEAVEDLLHATRDDEEKVRLTASAALKMITGLPMPKTPAAWESALAEPGLR